MAEHIRSAPSHEGDESQPPGGETDHASPEVSDPINPALSTSSLPEIENATIAPVSRHAAPSRSSSSSSRAAAGDDRTQLQKFIQDNDSDDEDVARLDAILHGLEKDQIHQRSEYAGNQSALDMAVERGMLWAVRRLLDYELQDKSILAEVDGDGRQALHLACLNGHRDIAALLLDQGAAIEATQSFGATPLDEACWKGHTAVVELLLSRHAKTQVIDNDGWSPIRSATQFERKDIVKVLLETDDANVNLADTDGETPLHVASRKGYDAIITQLLKHKADVNVLDGQKRTPVMLASQNGHDTCVKILCKARANCNFQADEDDVLWLLLATSKPIETRNARQLALNEAEAETSPKEKKGTGDTKPTNRSAQHEAQTEIEGRGKGNEEKELIKDGDPRTTDKPKARSTREQNKMLVLAILRDPPPTITSGEEERLQRPKTGTKQGDFLRKWVSKAAVIKYNVNNDKSTFFTQFRNVYEVIYGTGPTNITKEPTKTLEEMKRMNGSTIYQKICKLQEDRLGESLFTWVHLPATNIVWMNDLLKRILIDDPSALDDPQPEDCLSSKDGGAPEKLKTLESDGVDEKPKKTAEEGEDLEKPKKALTKSGDRERAKKASKVNSFFKASWSQIPDRISESRIMKPDYTTEPMRQETKGTESGGKIDESIVDSPENSLNAIYLPYLTLSIQRRGQDVDNIDQDSGKEEQKKKGKERERGKEDEVKGRKDRKEEDPRDEKLRGAHEAYLRLLKSYKGKVIHGSATLDESFYHFCRSQQNDDQGQEHSQPQEDRQIDEEEAAQQKDRQRRNESQVVTKGIHGDVAERPDWTLVRVNQLLDARLFEDFCERIGAKELKKEDKARVGEGGIPKEEEEAPRKRGKADRNEHTEDAIKAAASLSAKIRDIRDELQMLQAIAKHQMRVQKKLENGSYADAGLWENYITSDIGDMIGAADRIKSNVEMTLSLEQSQIANNQATESVKQSRLANKQADASVKQSKLANEQAKESVRQ
ncbi:hypothetical protein CEP53_015244, partial [Fusarium sp. AF-6]